MCLYVRSISSAEGRKLQAIVRSDSDRIKMRRAQVILASAQGAHDGNIVPISEFT